MTNARPSVDPAIIGFWQGVGGDYSLVNEYRADGTLIQYVGDRSSQPLPFRTEEGYVICSIEQPDHSIYEEKRRYEISGDTLTFIYSPRKKMHFQRRMEA